MEQITFNKLTDEEMARTIGHMAIYNCPVGIDDYKFLQLCSGCCADGCVLPQDGKKCWAMVKGEIPFPWWMVENQQREKLK